MIPEDVIAELRERADIEAVVSDYVPLKRAGASLKGLCPFHAEKTPSFHVHPARGFFHCFGCQASGDVIAFVMRAEGRSFPEAVRMLAERLGITLPEQDHAEDAAQRTRRVHRERLLSLMDACADYYVEQLRKHSLGGMAREALQARGIGEQVASAFRIGYAPHAWDHLARFLAQKGYSPADAEEVGVLVPRRGGSGHYDRFRHRLMFPVSDMHGRIVAFSGRILPPPPGSEPREAPKYINSPESALYTKGQVLFGLHEGRVEIRRHGWALLCEGNFDLLALHQAGFGNAVAPLGTALTEAQTRSLRRVAQRVTLLFDADAAGVKAVRAACPLLARAGLGARVARLPQGHDPDSYLRAKGGEALQTLLDEAPGAMEFLIDEAAASARDSSEKASAIEELGPVLGSVDNPVERQLYVERVAQKFQVGDLQAVKAQLRRGWAASRSGHKPGKRDEPSSAASMARSKDRVKLPQLQAELLGAILDNPQLIESEAGKNLWQLLTSPALQAIFRATDEQVRRHGSLDAARLLAEIQDDPARHWLEERLPIEKYDEHAALDALRNGLPLLTKQKLERDRALLSRQIREARAQGDEERALRLTKKRDQLLPSSQRASSRAGR